MRPLWSAAHVVHLSIRHSGDYTEPMERIDDQEGFFISRGGHSAVPNGKATLTKHRGFAKRCSARIGRSGVRFMSQSHEDLGVGRISKLFWTYSLPAIVATTASSVYNVIDRMLDRKSVV